MEGLEMGSYKIHVAKDHLMFCAAHFITFDGHKCEALHGHNYRARITLEGSLDENWYVYDFVTLKQLMKRLVDQLDHRVLLPLNNPLINLRNDGKHIFAKYKERRYVFPLNDTVLLPIPNTTAEMLAQYITKLVQEELTRSERGNNINAIELEIEESLGQSAIFREIFQIQAT
jgi:6-pyruvoyltetrahydropterin/6-carboxytetrahydropterin synthase